MGIRIEQSGGKGVITCDGELTAHELHDVRIALIKALIDFEEVALDLENVKNTDLACLQLLCSAHRSAGRLDKHLTFTGPRPDIVNRVAESAGYLRRSGCRLDKDHTCLWTDLYGRRAS